MRRTQLILEEWQYQTLRARAEREGRSLSDLLREILTAALHDSPTPAGGRLHEIEGIAEDTGTYGADHDDTLYRGRKKR